MLPKALSSLQHPLVKYLVKLRNNKAFRNQEKKVLLSGKKQIVEIAGHTSLEVLLISDVKAANELQAKETYLVSSEILKKVTGLESPEPIAAVAPMPSYSELTKINSLLVLDGIKDPGNIGALFRSALALGWDGIFLTEHSCDPFNDKALRAAKGAAFLIPFRQGDWEELERLFKRNEMQVYVADLGGKNFKEVSCRGPVALILGSESHGPSQNAKKSYEKISIPISQAMESLNVGAAGAILLYHLKEGHDGR